MPVPRVSLFGPLVAALGVALMSSPAWAQDPLTPPRVLQPAALVYPEGAQGEADVTVIVTVGIDGSVVDVAPYQGPEAFVPAAMDAAHQLRFAPARQDGHPVEVKVPVHFHFDPPAELPFHDDDVFEIVVEEDRASSDDTHAHTSLEGAALERSSGQDLAETVSQVHGVTLSRGTSDTAKPIIRGQPERRLLILTDGVRHESQKWGADHAPEIDPFSAGVIDVVKGAAGVRYGPDAIGGVLLVIPPELPLEEGVSGTARVAGVSNGRRGEAAARVDVVPREELALRAEASFSQGGAVSTPDYILGNTASTRWTLGATAAWRGQVGEFLVRAHHYDLAAGICYCVGHGSLEELQDGLAAERPPGADAWTQSADIDRPYQALTHDLALARATWFLGGGVLQTTYAFQLNRRDEYEAARDSVTGPQYAFVLRTHSLNVDWSHDTHELAIGPVHGGLGVAASFQENVYSGLPLIPNHRAFSGGVYGIERLELGRLELMAGLRYDREDRSSFLSESAFERHLARETLDEEDCERTDSAARCGVAFQAGSASVGARWLRDPVELKLDLSSASRFPDGDELYMNGAAPTSPVYGLGNPGLEVETTWGASPTMGLRIPLFEGEVSGFANRIDDYIYFAPTLGEDGEPEVDVTIRGAYPRFSYRPVDALFYGVDGGLSLAPDAIAGLELGGAVVRGVDRSSSEPLLFVPPDTVRGALTFRPPIMRVDEPRVQVNVRYVAEQTRVVDGADLAPPPDAYWLLGASIGAELQLGERALRGGLEGNNLLNARYRDYTSLLRYFAHEPGRELRLWLGFDF